MSFIVQYPGCTWKGTLGLLLLSLPHREIVEKNNDIAVLDKSLMCLLGETSKLLPRVVST
jgi:hypothetical protein